MRIADLRSLIGNVNQEAILFNDTFFNNIAFGVENATMEQGIHDIFSYCNQQWLYNGKPLNGLCGEFLSVMIPRGSS